MMTWRTESLSSGALARLLYYQVRVTTTNDDDGDEPLASAAASGGDAGDGAAAAPAPKAIVGAPRTELLPEVDAYFRVLVVLFLLDHKLVRRATPPLADA